MSPLATGSSSVIVSGLATTFVVVSSLTLSRKDTLGGSLKLKMDSIDLFPNDFLFVFNIPLSTIVLRSLPFWILCANRSGYANRSTVGGNPNAAGEHGSSDRRTT